MNKFWFVITHWNSKVLEKIYSIRILIIGLCPQITDLGQNWWSTVLKIEISCIQWQGSACTHDGPWFFLGGGAGGSCFLFCFLVQSLPLPLAFGQKWWSTVLEIKNICSQWAGWSMHSRCLDFIFLLSFGSGEDFFIFPLFPTCSLYVLFMFPMGFRYVPWVPNVFPKGVPNSTLLIPYFLPKVLPFSPT